MTRNVIQGRDFNMSGTASWGSTAREIITICEELDLHNLEIQEEYLITTLSIRLSVSHASYIGNS
jgi:hypothetical protein